MARTTSIITSLINGGKTAENIVIDSISWSVDNGTITLSAAAPASVEIGDTITDVNVNSFLITGLAGAVLSCQDFDSTVDPATGTGTIQEAYTSVVLWEADLDDTILYRSGDTAIGRPHKVSAFNENIAINGGATVGLNTISLTAAPGERHDGTAGNGARIAKTTGTNSTIIDIIVDVPVDVAWIEIDMLGIDQRGGIHTSKASSNDHNRSFTNNIIHGSGGGPKTAFGIMSLNMQVIDMLRNIIYDLNPTTGGNEVAGLIADTSGRTTNVLNNTVFKVVHGNTGNAFGVKFNDVAAHTVKNNIVMDTSSGGTSADYNLSAPVSADVDYNTASDTSASGLNSRDSELASAHFISTIVGMENLHLKTGANAIDKALDLLTTPTGVNIDIDGRDVDAQGDVWDMGAHEFVGGGGGGGGFQPAWAMNATHIGGVALA